MSYEKVYRFFDTKLGSQKNYYRLKVVEADGTSSYSQTILVNKEGVFSVSRSASMFTS